MTTETEKEKALKNIVNMRNGAFTKYLISVALMMIVALSSVLAFVYFSTIYPPTGIDKWSLLSSSILKFGAVTLGVYLTNLLYSFVRYFARMQYHLNSVRNIILIYNGDFKDLSSLHQVLNPSGIDFFKYPPSPTSEYTKIIQELVKKVSK